MRPHSFCAAVLVAIVGLIVSVVPTSAQELPPGVPDGAERATVTGYVDGDTFKVSLNRQGQTILLAGLDAPEPGECFAQEAADRIEALIPKGTKVYLQRDGDDRDGRDRLLRYVWVPREGAEAYLLNTKLVREGYAGFDGRHDNPRYHDRIAELDRLARGAGWGVWGACGALHAPVSAPALAGLPDDLERVTVESVTDGDTIRVRFADGRVEPVRLILIDTPETTDPNTPDECFGDRASDYTRERLTPGKEIWLERDVSDRDRFDRLLRYVWYDDGSGAAILFNERIVRDGFAVLSTFPPDVKHEGRIQAAQQEALNAGAGLWGACGGPDTPVEPPAPVPDPDPQPPPAATGCDPSYPGVCIPSYPPDLDCGEIGARRFQVVPPDPHGFDGDNDGVGCES